MDPNKLLFEAKKALERAYAPYSNYKVGAALVCDDGTVFTGCNIENASYGLTNCAERTALFSAIAAGKRKFKAIAIAASGEATPFPCGACRQALAELCGPDFSFYVASGADTYETTTLDELLPHRFDFRGSDD